MTKPRPPLSIDAALARIAGQLQNGWIEIAATVGRAETTVRKWGDHDQPEQIPMPAAIALDIAFQQAGGEGAPIFETYALLLQVSRETAFADHVELARRACTMIRESAEAEEALVLASLPGAGQRERDNALAQLKDVADQIPATIALLRAKPP